MTIGRGGKGAVRAVAGLTKSFHDTQVDSVSDQAADDVTDTQKLVGNS